MAQHAASTIQREGVDAFLKFVGPKLGQRRSRLDASFVNDKLVTRAIKLAKKWKGPSHPKIAPLMELLEESAKAGRKVIVFAELRDTVEYLTDLCRQRGLSAERFTGQGKRGGRPGMTQTRQRALLEAFSAGQFRILCGTSIAEEGLDIPQVDLVIFFEPVASDIRLIQRSGRTGRDSPGSVIVLTTDRSLDDRYLRSGLMRERRMKRLVKKLAEGSIETRTREAKPRADSAARDESQTAFDRAVS
jgi:Fanconi anemia group M protein